MVRSLILVLSLLATPVLAADSDNKIKGSQKVSMKVGQSKVIWGWRGECGKRPTGINKNRTRNTELGTLSIGDWGVFKSRTCGGWTPAVEIVFTAKSAGREVITTQFDQKITVTVK